MKHSCLLVFLLHSVFAAKISYYEITWTEDEAKVGKAVTVHNPRTVNFIPTNAYIIRQEVRSYDEIFYYLVDSQMELKKRRDVVNLFIQVTEEIIRLKTVAAILNPDIYNKDFQVSYMRETHDNVSFNFKKIFPTANGTPFQKRLFKLTEIDGEQFFIQVPASINLSKVSVEEVFLLQNSNGHVEILTGQKSSISPEIEKKLNIARNFANFMYVDETYNTVLTSYGTELWPRRFIEQNSPTDTSSECASSSSQANTSTNELSRTTIYMAWYSFVDDRFRTENLPITKLDFSMFEYRLCVIFYDKVFNDLFIYIKPKTPVRGIELSLIQAEQIATLSHAKVYIINNDYIPTHFLSLFKNFVQLLDQETTLDDKIQNIKRLLKFIE